MSIIKFELTDAPYKAHQTSRLGYNYYRYWYHYKYNVTKAHHLDGFDYYDDIGVSTHTW